jgi:curved DNA-binding protein CbpA
MRDPYETLGISPTAAADDIKTAYRKAARLYHPDRNPDPGAADRFRDIQAAYDCSPTTPSGATTTPCASAT